MRRLTIAVAAGLVAVLFCYGAIAVAARWALSAVNTLSVALYIVLDASQMYAHLVAWGAGVLAAVLVFLLLAPPAAKPGDEGDVQPAPSILRDVAGALLMALVVSAGVLAGAVGGWIIGTPDWRDQIVRTRWWLGDVTPPTVTVSVPSETVRGNAAIAIATNDDGDHAITRITIDGLEVPPAPLFVLDTSRLLDGAHTVAVDVEDASRQRNRATASAVFRTETQWWMNDRTPPAITLTVPAAVVQGVVTVAVATTDEGARTPKATCACRT